ncbi:MAG: glycoside hydrolase family 65 [Acidobacteria bacterium]|nr:MAG: glycoside hydrolase family 65 [Acidobacteriota bacterium]
MDRRQLVRRHNPVLTGIDPLGPLSVGNGQIAFTADITGLQTFTAPYETGIPLCTQSQWGWHSFPPLQGKTEQDLVLEEYQTAARRVHYMTRREGQDELFNWLRENPHRLHLGRIGLRMRHRDGSPVEPQDLTAAHQTLDLWTGQLHSKFQLDGKEVTVTTACHPDQDQLAFVVESSLVADGQLSLMVEFPYGSPAPNAADWRSPERHQSQSVSKSSRRLAIERILDDTRYSVDVGWATEAAVSQEGKHRFLLSAKPGEAKLAAVLRFTPEPKPAEPPSAEATLAASRARWPAFWGSGAAVELDGSTDKKAHELERRIVLSQYLTAIQCAGTLPPQETGLTCNSWYGKFHLEMHFWHAAHFPVWGRVVLLERSLDWYRQILPAARQRAREQGYAGARWPKMTGPEGRDSPSPIGPLLVWQQPHPIVFAELCYRSHPNRATLERFADVVSESADFMASYATHHAERGWHSLGPPVIPAQEIHRPRETWNPTYELAYWSYGLDLAQKWRTRLGLRPEARWDTVRQALAPCALAEGVYLAHENSKSFSLEATDHPSMLAAYGVLPKTSRVRPEIMRATLRRVMMEWHWETTWGWDYPMVAMTAARVGDAETAIDALLLDTPKNRYLVNGHNYQRPNLPLYLPGNGGLLLAVGMMAGGWEGGPSGRAPGFPSHNWQVRAEGLHRWI